MLFLTKDASFYFLFNFFLWVCWLHFGLLFLLSYEIANEFKSEYTAFSTISKIRFRKRDCKITWICFIFSLYFRMNLWFPNFRFMNYLWSSIVCVTLAISFNLSESWFSYLNENVKFFHIYVTVFTKELNYSIRAICTNIIEKAL